MRKNVRIPIEAYDPRIRELLLKGSLERVEIPCDTTAQRNSLRNQFFNYRARARDANLDGVEQMYRAKLELPRLKRPDGKYLLVIAPRGSEFNDVLEGATTKTVAKPLPFDPLSDLPVNNREGDK